MSTLRQRTTRIEISISLILMACVKQLTFLAAIHHYGYGAGRRICPGLHLAERNLWRTVAKLMWAFDILEPLDPATGKTIPIDENAFSSSILVAPLPFKVRIVPRSEKVLQSIRREKEGALDFLRQFDD